MLDLAQISMQYLSHLTLMGLQTHLIQWGKFVLTEAQQHLQNLYCSLQKWLQTLSKLAYYVIFGISIGSSINSIRLHAALDECVEN